MKLSQLTNSTPEPIAQTLAGLGRQTVKSRKDQRGFDLIQIAIVIGVIGILMAGAFLGVPAVMASVRATGEAQDLQAYVSNQQAQLNNSLQITNKTVIDEKLYNPDMVAGPTALRNRFSGTQTIEGDAGVATFTITSTQVPRRACEKLIPVVAPLFEIITVNETVVKNSRIAAPVLLNRATLGTACASATTGVATVVYEGIR